MANLPITLIPSTTPSQEGPSLVLPIVSERAKGAGFNGHPDAMHTVTYSTTNGFVGRIKMQATLATDPIDKDWYDVTESFLGNGTDPVFDQTVAINFAGNHVWVRAVIETFAAGTVNRIQYIHN